MKYIITGYKNGILIERLAFGERQAFIIINMLNQAGVADIGMREE